MPIATDRLTIEEFGRALRAGTLTATAVTEACLQQIDQHSARLNAFITVMHDDARRQAAEADRELAAGIDRGPLHGVPISIKDLLDIKGYPTTAASRVRDGHVAAHDADAITRLRRAGAVLVGKTNLHEYAFGTTSEDSAYGPVRNPLDPTRSPGGSSGGSAASIVTGMALASIGTDTGGSIRIPAAACGLVGVKPTFGEVDTEGVVPLSTTFDHVGPLAKTVGDAWRVYLALIGEETARVPAPSPVTSLRLAVPRRYFFDLLDDGVRDGVEATLERLRLAGVRVDDTDIHHAADIAPIYQHISFGDAAAYHATTLETAPEQYTPPVRARLEMARYIMAEDYVRALSGRDVLRREVDSALAAHDALALPALAIQAPPIGATTVPVGKGEELVRNMMLRLTQLFNVTGHPAIAIPCGRTAEGLPVSLQLVGARGQTAELLRVALACEPIIAGA